MSDQKCVVEGCNLEYDVICSFSFYNVNIGSESESVRQEWIEGAMQEASECLWRHVSLQLCGYHFELDAQGLWIDSPMLPELLTLQEPTSTIVRSASDKKAAELVRLEHNYSAEPSSEGAGGGGQGGEGAAAGAERVSRLNVRQLVDTLGYLSLKNLQRKQLWVVKVETDKAEASIAQAEQVITKMQDPKQIIEILPSVPSAEPGAESAEAPEGAGGAVEEAAAAEEPALSDNFIYEIAEEQEISMDEVKEIPAPGGGGHGGGGGGGGEWTVSVVPEQARPRYAYIKHCAAGKKKRHFTAEVSEITLQGDYENYYILPDADPSVGVEVTTSYEPDAFLVQPYERLLTPRRRRRDPADPADPPRRRDPADPGDPSRRKRRRATPATPVTPASHATPGAATVRDQVKQIKTELGEDWVIENDIAYEDADEFDERKGSPRVRRKNKKYLGYDFVT